MAALPGARMHGSPLRGVVRCVVPRETAGRTPAVALIGALGHPAGGTLVAETLPAAGWAAVPCMVDDRLSRGVRAAFDPAGILNPGILGERT